MSNSVLIYDCETETFGKPNADKDIFKFFGCYSYKTKKYYLLTSKEEIQKAIDAHKFLVGFNNEHYDNPILKRFGIKFTYKKIIDLRRLILERAASIKIKKGLLNDLLMEHSLDFITKTLGITNEEDGKLTIDYDIFKKNSWTKEELKLIYDYTIRDIEVTKKLYDFVCDYFDSFNDFLTEEDVKKKTFITVNIAKFSYKAICKAMGWEERYGVITGDEESFGGGYVGYPAGERFEGDIYCLDFNSLYPHIMIQCNLYGRKAIGKLDDRPIWTGGGQWDIEGTYYADKLSGVGELLKRWYFTRLYYKRQFVHSNKSVYKMEDIINYKGDVIWTVDTTDKNNHKLVQTIVDDKLIKEYLKLHSEGVDRREYTIKIIINTIYGLLGNAYYSLVYDEIAGSDCTKIGRQWTKYARAVFRAKGYRIIYTDTDSVYIVDPFNDKKKMLEVRDKIIKGIKENLPFPQDTFDMGIDDEIKYMFFFKGQNKDLKSDSEMDSDDVLYKPLSLLKKNYIYVTKDEKVKLKNLGIKKKNNSQLSKKIFWEHLVPQIKKGEIKFSKTYIKNLMLALLQEDIKLATIRYSVGDPKQYENSPNSIYAQLANRHGSGLHFVIPNTRSVGVGKGKSYCTIEEYKERKLGIADIDLSNVWKELDYFIKPQVTKNIFEF